MMEKREWMAKILAGILWITGVVSAMGAIPRTLGFQGKLTDQNGQVVSGNQSVILRLYNAASNGNKLWEEAQTINVSSAGIFSTQLGKVTPILLIFDQPYWVEVELAGEILLPRQPLMTSAYAFNTERFGGRPSSAFLSLDVNGAVRLVPSGAPSNPSAGTIYFNSANKRFYGFDGTRWKQLDN